MFQYIYAVSYTSCTCLILSFSIFNQKTPSNGPTTSPVQKPTESPVIADSDAPSISPSHALFEVEANVQFQLQGVTETLNRYAIGVFEQSCEKFLSKELSDADPHVFDITCKVTKQQLLSGRMLNESKLRHLQKSSSSLLLDIQVTGEVVPTKTVADASDVDFDAMVYSAFAENEDLFINSVKNMGDLAGIDDFDSLSGLDSLNLLNGSSGVSAPDNSNNGTVNQGAVAAIVIGGVAVVLLFGILIYQLRARDDGSIGSSSSADSEEFAAMQEEGFDPEPQYVTTYDAPVCKKRGSRSSVPPNIVGIESRESYTDLDYVQSDDSEAKHDVLTYAYSLDDAISPNSLSQGATPTSYGKGATPSRNKGRSKKQQKKWDDGVPIRIRRDVQAPPGKLGIIIDTSSQGPIIHSVKEGSVLEGLVFAGDLIVALDDEDTSDWSAHNLTRLVASKSKCERKITVLSLAD